MEDFHFWVVMGGGGIEGVLRKSGGVVNLKSFR